MTKVERIIAVLSGTITIVIVIWNTVSAIRSKPIPFWLYAVSTLAALVLGSLLGRIGRLRRKTAARYRLGILSFDYLPASPGEHGWHIRTQGENGKAPAFSMSTDAPEPGALRIIHSDRYFMDFTVDQTLSLSNFAEFFIRFANESLFYLRVGLSTRDGAGQREAWLCYKPYGGAPGKTSDDEWSVAISGDVRTDGWIHARISIADDVASTYGTEGWLYAGLRRIRLRGSLSLSSITFWRVEMPNDEVDATR